MAERRNFLDVRTPFFRPLLPRLIATGVTLGWAIFELANGNLFWMVLFGAAGLWLVWEFFVVFDPANYEEKDETFHTSVYKTKSEKFIVIGCTQTLSDEVRLIDADAPLAEPRVFASRRRKLEYDIEHFGDRLEPPRSGRLVADFDAIAHHVPIPTSQRNLHTDADRNLRLFRHEIVEFTIQSAGEYDRRHVLFGRVIQLPRRRPRWSSDPHGRR